MKKFLFVILFLSGCATFDMPPKYVYREIETHGWVIAAWQKSEGQGGIYHVYIEGDGNAFNRYGLPTDDPTPKSVLMRKMAIKDDNSNVIYLARPCQYVQNQKCEQKYWTTARFSQEVAEAEYAAIKNMVGDASVILIGYSGGAQIAGLVAVSEDLNVKKIVTIAGNLDHKAWTDYHRLPPLSESLNLADYKDQFALMPQVHYVGEKDSVVPSILTEKFIENKTLIKSVPYATHGSGWENLNIGTELQR